jgi:hypothetical protein
MGEERGLLRLGGLGGMLAGILLLLSLAATFLLVPVTSDIEETLRNYSDSRTARLVIAFLTLVAVILAIPLFLALDRMFRSTSRALASFGGVLGVLGLVMFAFVVAEEFVIIPTLANLLGSMSQEETTVVLLFQVSSGLLLTIGYIGSLFLAISFLSLGGAMFGSRGPREGDLVISRTRSSAWFSLLLGVVGVAVISLSPVLIEVSRAVAILSLLLLAYLLLLGWKVYSLSRVA